MNATPTLKPAHEPAVRGPSDSSDSGSDLAGAAGRPHADSDAGGTGERAGAGNDSARDAADIRPDQVIGDDEAAAGADGNEDPGAVLTLPQDDAGAKDPPE